VRQSDIKKIATAADDSIRAGIAARSAINQAKNSLSAGKVPGDDQPLINRVAEMYQQAVDAAEELVSAVISGGVESIFQTAQAVRESVETANGTANQFVRAPTVESAISTRDAIEKALAQLMEFKAKFHTAPELEAIKPFRLRDILESFPRLDASQAIGLLAGAAIFVLAGIGLVVLGFGILQTQGIVDKISQIGYARGLITYILAIGTVAVALVLVVSALLGTDASKGSFDRGKEILTVMIGIFGTILGFYFGQATSGQTAATPGQSPSPSPTVAPAGGLLPSPASSPTTALSPTATPSPAGFSPTGSVSPSAGLSPAGGAPHGASLSSAG
jgi:hypothetical protein